MPICPDCDASYEEYPSEPLWEPHGPADCVARLTEQKALIQARCTELSLTVRAATMFFLGKNTDDEKRNHVLVARQYPERPMPKSLVHPWGVYVVTASQGILVRDASYSDPVVRELAEKGRQFDTQSEALEYGQALLRELRA